MLKTTQVNVRLDNSFLNKAKKYAQKHGFGNVQELMKETLREKIYSEDTLTSEEYTLIKKLIQMSDEKNLWRKEEELFVKLNERKV